MGRMDDKVAIVTGAARGIGAASARLLASEGARVVLCDIREEQLATVGDEIVAASASALVLPLDVADAAGWSEAVREVESRFGHIDVLINNAGVCPLDGVEATTEEIWDHTVSVNQKGVWLGMRAVTPIMRHAGGGSIVNLSSILGLVGIGLAAAYQGTKGAVRLLTKTAAIELAPDHIRVNSIHPGFIETDLSASDDADLRAGLEALTPLGRYGQPEEIAAGVLYLASNESSYVTGCELVIDGGYTAR